MILTLENLSRSFGSVTVADGIDLSDGEGAAVGIIGPNGAGKSSLFNVTAGDIPPDSGTIRLDGADITATPPEARCRAGIGRSHQIPKPFETLTVFENLLVGALYGSDMTEARAVPHCAGILERTGLFDRANRLAGSLTLLERKRLEMARALATRPRLLLLDEIAGGLTDEECAVLVKTIADVNASAGRAKGVARERRRGKGDAVATARARATPAQGHHPETMRRRGHRGAPTRQQLEATRAKANMWPRAEYEQTCGASSGTWDTQYHQWRDSN